MTIHIQNSPDQKLVESKPPLLETRAFKDRIIVGDSNNKEII